MEKQITEVQLIEPQKLESGKQPKRVKLKFPFMSIPVEMNDYFFQKILNDQQYKIVENQEDEN